jgi:3-deoxy-D-manno-octulosonic-acid transferase
MKFDTALAFDEAAAARAGEALHAAVWDESWNRKFGSRGPVLLLGSSGPCEEKMMLDLYRQLLCEYPTLRLAIVPRKPERFDEVRMLISESGFAVFSRSSGVVTGPMGRSAESERAVGAAVVLGDTMGELRSFYAMADVVVVGRTLVDLGQRQHGSDMIEPAALGKAVIVGRYTGNFAGAMSAFRSAGAMIEVNDENELGVQVRGLLNNANKRTALGQLARDVARASRGATSRHMEVIFRLMKQAEPTWQPPETSGR